LRGSRLSEGCYGSAGGRTWTSGGTTKVARLGTLKKSSIPFRFVVGVFGQTHPVVHYQNATPLGAVFEEFDIVVTLSVAFWCV